MDGSGPALDVREIAEPQSADRDAFVLDCADATFFHLSGWKSVIERSLGHRRYLLAAYSGGLIHGVMSFLFCDEIPPYYGGDTARTRDLA